MPRNELRTVTIPPWLSRQIKPVFLLLSRLLELQRTLARLHRTVRNTFSAFLTIIMAKSCLHLLLGNVHVEPTLTCIYGIKWCQPKCPDSSLRCDFPRCYLTHVSEIRILSPQTLRTPSGQRQPTSVDGRPFSQSKFSSSFLESWILIPSLVAQRKGRNLWYNSLCFQRWSFAVNWRLGCGCLWQTLEQEYTKWSTEQEQMARNSWPTLCW
jgi:hypothetical protein